MEEESFEIKVILGEKEIREAILDYLDKHGYIVSDYNYASVARRTSSLWVSSVVWPNVPSRI